jgi:hypothetical protein
MVSNCLVIRSEITSPYSTFHKDETTVVGVRPGLYIA